MVLKSAMIVPKNLRRMFKHLRDIGRNYCENTSLHGFRYIIGKENSTPAKLIWLIICVISASVSIYFTHTVWVISSESPTKISVESTTYPISKFRFPSVTICNANKVDKVRGAKVAEKMRANGMNESEIQCFLNAVPSMVRENYSKRNYHKGIAILKRIGIGPEDMMYDLMQPCDQLLLECFWRNQKYNCSEIFKTVKSYQGFCCSFNYHVLKGGYSKATDENLTSSQASSLPGVSSPLRVPGSGQDNSLFVVLNVEAARYRSTIKPVYGASVIIHDPRTYPEVNIRSMIVQPGEIMIANLKATIIESSDNVRELKPYQRKCWFEDELNLNTTNYYRYASCTTECRMEFYYYKCGCVPFYYPNTMPDVRICGLVDVPCLKEQRGLLSLLETPDDYADVKALAIKKAGGACRHECMPECKDRWYDVTSEGATFIKDDENLRNFGFENSDFDYAFENESIIQVYFPDISSIKYRRKNELTWENLLAACGGIFGLCIGGSFVSFIEIAYFLVREIYALTNGEKTSAKKKQALEKVSRIDVKPITEKNAFPCAWNNFEIMTDFNFPINRGIVSTKLLDTTKRELPRPPFIIDLKNN